ncbi:Protein arv1 [Neolecta irregularis DAH-3]|uniref:Protein ARV n=1 Tax=Neolecta irregularis (strain DAH-3) TaxID=1198029 RepID=A0A1U7LQ25_NEOID|nr:Protein arv1 [Neolecta irregularis DAH-3]|eukprot:OLL24621.1 Protein arv1 [Neolecta irregularis DAH-3]
MRQCSLVEGNNADMTQPNCKLFADKYVEHDYVVLFIDIVLFKPQVYRHLLFNRLRIKDDEFDPRIRKLAILLVLFDVYLTWHRFEMMEPFLTPRPVLSQYLYLLFLCVCEMTSLHYTIRLLAKWLLGWSKPNAISTALLISSSTKLLPILMVIWSYDVPFAARIVAWVAVLNNIEALTILLQQDYITTTSLVLIGVIVRGLVGLTILQFSSRNELTYLREKYGSFGVVSWLSATLGVS